MHGSARSAAGSDTGSAQSQQDGDPGMILVPTVIPTVPSAHATTQVRSIQSSTFFLSFVILSQFT